MDRLEAWQETAKALGKGLTQLVGQIELSWQALHTGFSGLAFLALAGGVVAFTRRREDLFAGFSVGWGFALALGAVGILMIADPLAPAANRGWVRGAQVLAGPVALVLMAGFLLRLRGMETYTDSEAREADLANRLRQTQRELEALRAKNAELTRLKDQAASENRRLASEHQAALHQAEAMRTREADSGLYTWNHFVERLNEEFERSSREGRLPLPLFIGLQDLASLGAEAREDLVARAGGVIRQDLRLPDLGCRFGSAMFLVVPYETDTRGAAALARRLNRRLKRELARATDSGRPTPGCAFVVLEFEVRLVRFEDYLEACERSAADVDKQPPNRLTQLPARFTDAN